MLTPIPLVDRVCLENGTLNGPVDFPWRSYGRRFTLLEMLKIAAHDWDEIWRELRQLDPMDAYSIDVKAHVNKVLVAALEGGSAKDDLANSLEKIASHCTNIG